MEEQLMTFITGNLIGVFFGLLMWHMVTGVIKDNNKILMKMLEENATQTEVMRAHTKMIENVHNKVIK